MPYVIIGTSDDMEFVNKLNLVFYDIEREVARIVEFIQIGPGYPTYDLFENSRYEMDEYIEQDNVMEEYRRVATDRISMFIRLSGVDFNIPAYGEIGYVAINHKEQEYGIILFRDEDDECPLNDIHRSNLIGTVFGLISR